MKEFRNFHRDAKRASYHRVRNSIEEKRERRKGGKAKRGKGERHPPLMKKKSKEDIVDDTIDRCDQCHRLESASVPLRSCTQKGCSATFCRHCASDGWMCYVCNNEDNPIPGTYRDKRGDGDKAIANAIFVHDVFEDNGNCAPRRRRRLLVLDGPKGGTARRLLGMAGELDVPLRARDIDTPNADPAAAKALGRIGVSKVHHMRFSKLIREKKGGYDAIFYDACGSWAGSTSLGFNPREDARRIFSKGLRRNGGSSAVIAAFTFNNCRRRRGPKFLPGDVEAELCVMAEQFRWSVKTIKRYNYKNMRFWCFSLLDNE